MAAALTLASVFGVAVYGPVFLAVAAVFASPFAVGALASVISEALSHLPVRVLLGGAAVLVVAASLAVRVRAVDWGRLVAAAPLSVAQPTGLIVAAAVLITVAVAVLVAVSNRTERRAS